MTEDIEKRRYEMINEIKSWKERYKQVCDSLSKRKSQSGYKQSASRKQELDEYEYIRDKLKTLNREFKIFCVAHPKPRQVNNFITDHAVIRYLERVHHIDIDALRRIIEKKVMSGSERPGGGIVTDECVFIKSETIIATVKTFDMY